MCLSCGRERRETTQERPTSSEWTRVVTIDGDEHDLTEADEGALLSDGGVVVVNRGAQELLWFDSAGRLMRRAGRRGGGPAEFRWLNSAVVLPNDTVLAFDGGLRRLSTFDSHGRLVASTTIREGLAFSAKLMGRVNEGTLLFLNGSIPAPRERAPGTGTDSSDLVLYSRRSGSTQIIGTVPTRNRLVWGEGAGAVVTAAPFPATLQVGFCRESTVIAFGEHRVVSWGRATTNALSENLVQFALRRPPLEDRIVDSLRQGRASRPADDLAARRNAALAVLANELKRPYFERAALDIDGSLWLLVTSHGDAADREWQHFDRLGPYLGRARFGDGDRILAMSERRVLLHGRTKEGVDVFTVVARPAPVPSDRCSGALPATVTSGLPW